MEAVSEAAAVQWLVGGLVVFVAVVLWIFRLERMLRHLTFICEQISEVEANRKEALADDSGKFPHFLNRRPPEELPRTPYLPGFV